MVTDKRPTPFSLPGRDGLQPGGPVAAVGCRSYHMILIGAAMVGLGSSVFHPESSRVARMDRVGATASRSRCSN